VRVRAVNPVCGVSGRRLGAVGSVQRRHRRVTVPDGDRARDSILGRGGDGLAATAATGTSDDEHLLSLAVMTLCLHGMMPRPAG